MVTRKVPFAIEEYYHLYNRGVEKRLIFKDKKDYEHFILLMYVCNTEKKIELREIDANFERGNPILDIGAYCLMPNHFHLLVREKQEKGISLYMLKLLTAYSMYFNQKYKRTGTLYEGAFKSAHCTTDTYLKYLYAYIHLNPAKLVDKNWREQKGKEAAHLLDYVCSYYYSSISEYANSHYHILNPSVFPNYFDRFEDHRKELFEWLAFNPEGNPPDAYIVGYNAIIAL